MTERSPSPRLAYLVPEFPGQTHAFFWREVEALEAAGSTVDLVSTTMPKTHAVHPWAGLARARTSYLARPRIPDAAAAALTLSRALVTGRIGTARRRMGSGPVLERARVLLAAALLAGRSRRAGWMHVHVHSSGNSAQVAMIAAALGPLTYSVTLHGPLSDYGPQQVEKWRHAAFGLVITEQLRAELAAAVGPEIVDRIALAPMGIRLADTERPQPYRPWEGRGDAVLFSCGRLNPAKGHDTLIRAVSILGDEGLPVRLAIAGEDEAGGSGYRRDLERLIRRLDVADRVQLLGAIGEDAVRGELQQTHVFVLASRGEPLGVAVMEAMGYGVPAVVGDGGGVRELIEPGTGVLVRPGDPVALADAIRRVLAAPDDARAIGERGRARVRAHFTSESSARVLAEAIVCRMAERRRPVRP
ncbi:MAG: glycosyltransferase family 4 protein [Microbacterium sp.]|uniref:exopolysaccharide biosynthesis GT4 family glycosyltransferase EpsE n=1 Tax=Microbacterium sp. TaxID=51671 RepID=UPI002622D96B|nr:exopolysaccharide biosynthesis GT4 family glycosyltransferase EpsE [Microbacterium sp.]MCX6502858.1 glycosyltransferase family 4 protein [Microbacterium sp.]